jgi:hypothetical protein
MLCNGYVAFVVTHPEHDWLQITKGELSLPNLAAGLLLASASVVLMKRSSAVN